MRNFILWFWKRRFSNGNGKSPFGYKIPPIVWMTDLKKAADCGAVLAEKERRLKGVGLRAVRNPGF